MTKSHFASFFFPLHLKFIAEFHDYCTLTNNKVYTFYASPIGGEWFMLNIEANTANPKQEQSDIKSLYNSFAANYSKS